jgi:hypothetical protein
MAYTQNGEKANGAEKLSSTSQASSTTPIEIGERLAGKAKPKPNALKLEPTKADKKGVANAFERHSQVLQARVKPLPTQAGTGTFYENPRWGKLRNDLKALRIAGTASGNP